MLRGKSERTAPPGSPPSDLTARRATYPTAEEPLAVEEQPIGIAFYKAKESFFLPYALLECIRFTPDKITLLFAPATVAIEGRGLHQLYVQLAARKISRIVERAERYADAADASFYISKIEELPKTQRAAPAQSDE